MKFKDTPQPGEWQTEVNAYGGVRRYRMIGNCKEYEMMVTVDGMQIPQSELSAYHERKRQQEEARKLQEAKEKPRPLPDCPFSSGMDQRCKGEKCAIYMDGCTLARIGKGKATKDTQGAKCPFNGYTCNKSCALYVGGCTLTAVK